MRARSSTGQSIGLRIRGLGVQIPSGAPIKSRVFGATGRRAAFLTATFDSHRTEFQPFSAPNAAAIFSAASRTSSVAT